MRKTCNWRGEMLGRASCSSFDTEGTVNRRLGHVVELAHRRGPWKQRDMSKELPILPPGPSESGESVIYSRVFCQRENSPPLRLLIDFLRAHGQLPIIPSAVDGQALNEWAWVQVALGYRRDRKPIHLFCVRDRGSYKDIYDQEKARFLELLSLHDDSEARLAQEYIIRCRFIITSRIAEKDVTDEGYDFNGWILEFYQDQCSGIVQIDNRGFYSPKGELIVDMSVAVED